MDGAVWSSDIIIKSIITAMDHFISAASASSVMRLHEYFKVRVTGLMIPDDNDSPIDSALRRQKN